MASRAELVASLKTRRATVVAQLEVMNTSSVGGKANASGPGLNVDHVGYRKSLYEELKMIDEQLQRYDVGFVTSCER